MMHRCAKCGSWKNTKKYNASVASKQGTYTEYYGWDKGPDIAKCDNCGKWFCNGVYSCISNHNC